MNKRKILLLSWVLVLLNFLTCNIFSPDKPDAHKWYMTGEAWVVEGKKKMWNEEWSKAIECFEKALSIDSSFSEAYFYIGKCILRNYNVDLNQVWNEIKPKDDTTNKQIPFLYSPPPGVSIKGKIPPFTLSQQTATIRIDSVFLERKRIYDAVSRSIVLLEIVHRNSHKMDGIIKREQYESDYLVEMSVKTVLGIIDVNDNGKLDWLDSGSITQNSSHERTTFRILCQDIQSLDSMHLDSLITISKNPRDINIHLDSILNDVLKANESYDNFFKDIKEGSQQNKNLDTNMAHGIGSLIKKFIILLPYYYYDDFHDNDGDFWNTDGDLNGAMNRMVWIDWDWDQKIDIYSPSDTLVNGHIHIGDSTHRFENPQWYEPIDSMGLESHRYRYKGPYTYEFIGGDWGVDEEILDGKDNDGDGLNDEDTRIAPDSIDDDGDYYDTDQNSFPTPMIWVSSNDWYLDILQGVWKKVPLSPTYKNSHKKNITSVFPDSLSQYIGPFLNQKEFIGGDYGLDEEWFDGVDNDRDGLIDEDIGLQTPPKMHRKRLIEILQGGSNE